MLRYTGEFYEGRISMAFARCEAYFGIVFTICLAVYSLETIEVALRACTGLCFGIPKPMIRERRKGDVHHNQRNDNATRSNIW